MVFTLADDRKYIKVINNISKEVTYKKPNLHEICSFLLVILNSALLILIIGIDTLGIIIASTNKNIKFLIVIAVGLSNTLFQLVLLFINLKYPQWKSKFQVKYEDFLENTNKKLKIKVIVDEAIYGMKRLLKLDLKEMKQEAKLQKKNNTFDKIKYEEKKKKRIEECNEEIEEFKKEIGLIIKEKE